MKSKKSLVYPWQPQEEKRYKLIKFENDNILKTTRGILTDYSSLSFHSSFGFNNRVIANEMKNQINHSLLTFSKFEQQFQTQRANELLDLLELEGHIFFTQGGADSVEHALKISRESNQRKVILSRRKSYHGASLGALQITGDHRRNVFFLPKSGHHWIPEPKDDPDFSKTLSIIHKIGANNISGICLESITAKNGVYILPATWIDGLRQIQSKYKINIIFDEVVCGFYRTLKPFGFHHYEIKPDIVCMGKAISNGMAPLGAVYFSPKIMKCFNSTPFKTGHTNYGHPISLAALKGVLKYVKQKSFKNKIETNSKILKDWIKDIEPFIAESRGTGFLYALDLKSSISHNVFYENGISIVLNESTLILCPTISLTKQKLIKDLSLLFNVIRRYS